MRYIDHIRAMSDADFAYFLNFLQPEIELFGLSHGENAAMASVLSTAANTISTEMQDRCILHSRRITKK